MNLIAYIRVSTDEQASHGHSLGQQIDRLNAYAALHGHQLVGVIADEGVSGSVPIGKRKGGAQVIAALREGKAQGVVVVRLDRLFRNALDGLRFFEEEIESVDASVHSLTESVDTSTPSGWLALIMQLAVADYARRLDVQRGRETNRALRESGKVYGNVPFGCVAVGGEDYQDDGKARTRGAKLFRAPTTWAIRQGIVNLRRGLMFDGQTELNGGCEMSYAQIARHLRLMGYLSPEGSRTWSKSTLANICETHADLCHLPMLGAEGTAEFSTSIETRVSCAGAVAFARANSRAQGAKDHGTADGASVRCDTPHKDAGHVAH